MYREFIKKITNLLAKFTQKDNNNYKQHAFLVERNNCNIPENWNENSQIEATRILYHNTEELEVYLSELVISETHITLARANILIGNITTAAAHLHLSITGNIEIEPNKDALSQKLNSIFSELKIPPPENIIEIIENYRNKRLTYRPTRRQPLKSRTKEQP